MAPRVNQYCLSRRKRDLYVHKNIYMRIIPNSDQWQKLRNGDYDSLKREIIAGSEAVYSFGRTDNLDEHIDLVRREFAGRSYLEFFHAVLTVLIRRAIDTAVSAELFRSMWAAECAFLTERLDTRWLISACDTIVDLSDNSADVAAAYAGSLFMNTIKLYETEILASGAAAFSNEGRRSYRSIEGRVPLFDGMSAFIIGRGDMIANLYERARRVCRGETPAQIILAELLKRANENNTVFRRFAEAHLNKETIWRAPGIAPN